MGKTVKKLSVDISRPRWLPCWLCSRRVGTTGIVKMAAEEVAGTEVVAVNTATYKYKLHIGF